MVKRTDRVYGSVMRMGARAGGVAALVAMIVFLWAAPAMGQIDPYESQPPPSNGEFLNENLVQPDESPGSDASRSSGGSVDRDESSGGGLAVTGADLAQLAVLGVVLVGAGATLTLVRRRRIVPA